MTAQRARERRIYNAVKQIERRKMRDILRRMATAKVAAMRQVFVDVGLMLSREAA